MVGGPTIKNIEACADELVKMVANAVPVKKLETFKVSDLLLPQQGVVPEALTKGKQIFKCPEKHGLFLRGFLLKVGDFPELEEDDLWDSESDSEEEEEEESLNNADSENDASRSPSPFRGAGGGSESYDSDGDVGGPGRSYRYATP